MRGFEACVTSLGGQAEHILSQAGITLEQIGDEDSWMPFESVLLAYELASRDLDDPEFGFKLVNHRDFSFMGPMYLTARHAESLYDALEDITRYMMVQNTGWTPSLSVEDKSGIYIYGMPLTTRAIANQWIEESLATGVRVCAEFLDRPFQASLIQMRHSRLNPKNVYESVFGCEVLFDQPVDALHFHRSDLESAIPNRDLNTHEFMAAYLAQRLPRSKDVVASIQLLLKDLIPLGKATIEVVADQLSLHPRTLQRRLEAIGITFAKLLDQERRRLAEEMLRQGSLPVINIAFYLGYSNQSAFNHAFKRWHGVSPTAWLRRDAGHS